MIEEVREKVREKRAIAASHVYLPQVLIGSLCPSSVVIGHNECVRFALFLFSDIRGQKPWETCNLHLMKGVELHFTELFVC